MKATIIAISTNVKIPPGYYCEPSPSLTPHVWLFLYIYKCPNIKQSVPVRLVLKTKRRIQQLKIVGVRFTGADHLSDS